MNNFFKTLLASFLGSGIAMTLVALVFFVMIVGAITSAASGGGAEQTTKVKGNSILHITFEEPIVE